MSKRKKRRKKEIKSLIALTAKLLIGLGTFLAGLGTLIEAITKALNCGKGAKAPLLFKNIIAHLIIYEKTKIQRIIFTSIIGHIYCIGKRHIYISAINACIRLYDN